MSGQRQHTIPKFLLKGFSENNGKNNPKIRCLRKGQEPILTGINNVSVQNKFYTFDDDIEADTFITDVENDSAKTTSYLRSITGAPAALYTDLILILVELMKIRNEALRSNFLSTSLQFYTMLEDNLNQHCKRFTQIMINEVGIRSRDRGRIKAEIKRSIAMELPKFIDIGKSATSEATKIGHIDSIREKFNTDYKLRYKQLSWSVCEYSDLIVGDNILIFEIDDKRRFVPYPDKKNNILSLYLPISRTKILYGYTTYSPLDEKQLLTELAKCSTNSIYSHPENISSNIYTDLIGENSHLITDAEVRDYYKSNLVDFEYFLKDRVREILYSNVP